jgi:hypothetical protein
MQATGMVNDHEASCLARATLSANTLKKTTARKNAPAARKGSKGQT